MAFNMEVVGKTFGPSPFEYDEKAPALYALACGAGPESLDLVYEARGPKVLPSFAVVTVYQPLLEALVALGGNMLTLVHGAQKIIVHQPLPASGTLSTTVTVESLFDKGKGALAVIRTQTSSAAGVALFETEWQIFYRGEGGFGGERGPDAPANTPPEGIEPQHVIDTPTQPGQALLYRLASGDLNPIHVDPVVAEKAKFPQPILHGLCTFGFATRALVDALCGGDPDKLQSVEGRFVKPVFPGERIVTSAWPAGDGEAVFVSKVKDRDEVVIGLGRAKFRS